MTLEVSIKMGTSFAVGILFFFCKIVKLRLHDQYYPTFNDQLHKGSDRIRLLFAHPFPLNNRAPVASADLTPEVHDGWGSVVQD